MRCAWQAFLKILPLRIREEVDRLGAGGLLELRLRMSSYPELVFQNGSQWLTDRSNEDDISFVINAASRYSPWTASTMRRGYITAPGGHRVGICGDAVIHDGQVSGIREPASLCLRVARDFPGIAKDHADMEGSVLIIGKPGSGKTTLLRDMIRQRSNHGVGAVGVVDERGEVFPKSEGKYCFPTGRRTDILTGCSKKEGIEMLLRTMGPDCIAVDEITAREDSAALLNALWSGVDLLATAHAESVCDLKNRQIYRTLMCSGFFRRVFVMQTDKTWREELLEQ